jgi:hypothetical protein
MCVLPSVIMTIDAPPSSSHAYINHALDGKPNQIATKSAYLINGEKISSRNRALLAVCDHDDWMRTRIGRACKN